MINNVLVLFLFFYSMRVRTRREGVDNNFTVAGSLCDVASLFTEPQGAGDVRPQVSGRDVIQYNVRSGSRTAFLLRNIALCCRLASVPERKPEGIATVAVSTRTTVNDGDREVGVSFADREAFAAQICANDEVDRREIFLELSSALEEAFQWRGVFPDTNVDFPPRSLVTPQVSRELLARWVMQSLNETTEVCAYRDAVTLLDRGATVCLRHDTTAPHTVVDMADMVGGQYWVDVEAAPSSSGSRKRVDRNDVLLHPPQPVYFDPLFPADELNSARGTSTCLFLAATLAVRELSLPREGAAVLRRSLKEFPKDIAVRMGQFAREARQRLYTRCTMRRACGGADATALISSDLVEVRMTRDCVTLRYAGQAIEVLQRALQRLSLLWDERVRGERLWAAAGEGDADSAQDAWKRAVAQQAAAADGVHTFTTSKPFFLRAFTMLLRYRSLFGDMGYNQGPHAAIPPVVLRQLHDAFDIHCEAFASPLNAQLPRFGSLFPDTDHYFGSLGAFFDLSLVSGHYEVNPPFVTAVLQKLQTFLLHDVLAKHDGVDDPSMLFVVVLPSHDLDEAERELHAPPAPRHHHRDLANDGRNNNSETTHDDRDDDSGRGEFRRKRGRAGADGESDGRHASTERILRESAFCLAHTLCAAAESAYVDGHQHLLRAPLFCIRTPTRLIVLGNCAARCRYGDDAAERLFAVRETWRRFTADSAAKAEGARSE